MQGPRPLHSSGLSPRFWLPLATMAVMLLALGTVLYSVLMLHHHRAAETIELVLLAAGSALMIGIVFQAISQRKREMRRMKQYLSSLELLAETSAAIGQKVGSSSEILMRLPQIASDVMGMSLATIALLEDGGVNVRAVSSAGVDPEINGRLFRIDDVPTVKRSIETRGVVTISDLRTDTSTPINRALVEKYQLRSVMQTPLMLGNEVIGVLLLGSTEPRDFSAQDIRLAELWSAQAAVTLANDRLYNDIRQALASRDLLLRQRDELFKVSSEISRPGPLQEVLQLIADLSPALLQVDGCQVNLLAEDSSEFEVAAITAKFSGTLIGSRFKLKGTNAERVMENRKMLLIEDPRDPSLHPYLREVLPSGSVAYFPLLNARSEPLGLLVLMREKSGLFAAEQIALAQLFSVRAASAIESAQLHEQTRHDAETRAMLLRELNHRVKNNLAGIVTLLSLDEPELSPAARKWLDRVIDRVRTMAHTHEMFAGNAQRVGLRELIDQTLRSLSVARPPGVMVQTDASGPEAFLRTDRAVSLAMVLHELCYNALVHGVNESGRVTIKIHRLAPQSLAIEIADDGLPASDGTSELFGPAASTLAPVRTGLGLTLVRGLVGRELRGAFSLDSNESGGMTARVEIPLLDDEIHDPGI